MNNIVVFLVFFIVIYFCYFIFVISKKQQLEKYKKSSEVLYLVKKYKVDLKKIDIKKLAHITSSTNALIISLTITVVGSFDNILFIPIIGFPLVIILILIMYHIIGVSLKRREDKNV